jgi:hypothetical protein
MWVGVGRLAGSQLSSLGTGKKLKGRDDSMADVIEFYVPESFRKCVTQVPSKEPGKVIEFRPRPVNTLDRMTPKTVRVNAVLD